MSEKILSTDKEAQFDHYGIEFIEPLGGAPMRAIIGEIVFGKKLTGIHVGLGAGYPIFELWFEDLERMSYNGISYTSLLAPKPEVAIDELNPDEKIEGVEEQKEIPQGA